MTLNDRRNFDIEKQKRVDDLKDVRSEIEGRLRKAERVVNELYFELNDVNKEIREVLDLTHQDAKDSWDEDMKES